MRSFFFFILSFFTMANAGAQFSENRQVLIFGEPQNTLVRQQLALLKKEAAGVEERDIKITQVTKKMEGYKKYKVDPSKPFTLILVGKDGGEKFRSEKITTPQQLFQVIDAMPMRQSEMRRHQKPE
jgi:hypothetical protein